MQRPALKWLLFAACLAIFVGAMGWITARTLELERQRELAENDAQAQERVRLALWRMDAVAGSLVMRENARPPNHYQAFYSPEEVFSSASTPIQKGRALVPSPLLGVLPEFVLLHFEIAPGSAAGCASPQVPAGKDLQLATNWYSASPQAARAAERLRKLNTLLLAHPEAISSSPAREQRPAAQVTATREASPSNTLSIAPLPAEPLPAPVLAEVERLAAKKEPLTEMKQSTPQVGENAVSSRQGMLNTQELTQRNALVRSQTAAPESGSLLLKRKELAPDDAAARQLAKTAASSARSDLAAGKPSSAPQLADVTKRYRAPAAPAPAAAASAPAEAAAPRIVLSGGGGAVSPPGSPPAPARAPSTADKVSRAPAKELAVETPAPAQTPPSAVAMNTAEGAPSAQGDGFAAPAAAARQDAVLDAVSQEDGDSAKPFDAQWIEGELFLFREALLEGARRSQGVWLDWPQLEKRLLSAIADLLPAARLIAAPSSSRGLDATSLASLPARLVPGALELPAAALWSPLRRALAIAWGCFLLASLAVGLVLHRAITLSERRGAFVSAVTHELRTPLTTFRLYTEMLADDMVPDAAARQKYLRTLCDESTRLTHLVENVLAYSRIERGRAAARVEEVTLAALMARIEPRLRQRAAEAALELDVVLPREAAEVVFKTDAMGVEQILFNLVDNACKYAGPGSTPRMVRVVAEAPGSRVVFRVRDHGPGFTKQQMKRLFQPFEKSAADAAHSAPGVGLGLALCRRLAREMGGDLCLEAAGPGACFVLTLPRD
jgi:signal transduction histidine kinase